MSQGHNHYDFRCGSTAELGHGVDDVRFAPNTGSRRRALALPLCADCVDKVRNTPADRNLIEWCFSRDDSGQICFDQKSGGE